MVWNNEWTIDVDGTALNDHVSYITTIPELQALPPQRVVLAPIDGDYPVFIRSQPAEGSLTFLIAMKGAGNPTVWDTRITALTTLFATGIYHTLTAKVRGMPNARSMRFITESLQPDFRTRTVVVYATAPRPVLV
jgi:hypothetical protein